MEDIMKSGRDEGTGEGQNMKLNSLFQRIHISATLASLYQKGAGLHLREAEQRS